MRDRKCGRCGEPVWEERSVGVSKSFFLKLFNYLGRILLRRKGLLLSNRESSRNSPHFGSQKKSSTHLMEILQDPASTRREEVHCVAGRKWRGWALGEGAGAKGRGRRGGEKAWELRGKGTERTGRMRRRARKVEDKEEDKMSGIKLYQGRIELERKTRVFFNEIMVAEE